MTVTMPFYYDFPSLDQLGIMHNSLIRFVRIEQYWAPLRFILDFLCLLIFAGNRK